MQYPESTTEYGQLLIDLLKQGKFTAEVGEVGELLVRFSTRVDKPQIYGHKSGVLFLIKEERSSYIYIKMRLIRKLFELLSR